MKMQVTRSYSLDGKWDEYVEKPNACTLFHHSAWIRAVEKTFGHKPYHLFLEESGQIRGILPLFLLKSILFGKLLISSAYSVYGGICAENADAENLLLEEAIKIAQSENVKYIELRNVRENSMDLPEKDLYVTFIRELPHNADECLGMFPRKARAAVRKGIKYGLEAEFGLHRLKECYSLYARNKRDLGSPCFPFAFFENLAAEFGEQCTVLCVKHQGRIVASVLTFFFKDTVSPQCSGSLPEYHQYQVNNFMYFKLMEYGVENGYKYFDFGRSRKDTGSYHFKCHQGFEPQQLHYQYYLHRAKHIPNVSPSNPRFSLPKLIWKKLPLPLATGLSVPIVRRMPY